MKFNSWNTYFVSYDPHARHRKGLILILVSVSEFYSHFEFSSFFVCGQCVRHLNSLLIMCAGATSMDKDWMDTPRYNTPYVKHLRLDVSTC